jgi:hypothetical protein
LSSERRAIRNYMTLSQKLTPPARKQAGWRCE